jgi:hypothetical protein
MNTQYHPPPKKEITFPPDSIEAVQPLLNKRKKIISKDVGKCGVNQIFHCIAGTPYRVV